MNKEDFVSLEVAKLLKEKGFNVECEFKPFDKVLVRDYINSKWEVDIFRHIVEENTYRYSCLCDTWKYCIPYEGNEHLLGTTKSAEE